jgi:hypothetical protein
MAAELRGDPRRGPAGVKRVGLATSPYRAAMTGLVDAAREVKDTGRFSFLDRCRTTPELNQVMRI